jgi:hypothetical protein
MPVNPYVLPAKYEYKPLPLDFMLQAGLAQQGRQEKGQAAIDALDAENALIPSGWRSKTVAKTAQDLFQPKIDAIATAYADGTYTPNEAILKTKQLKLEMAKNPLVQFAQNDAGLKEFGAKQGADKALHQGAYQNFMDLNTGNFNQIDPNDVLSGKVTATPELYSLMARPDFRTTFDPVFQDVKPEKFKWEGKPQTVTVGYNAETGEAIQKTANTKEELEKLNKETLMGAFGPYAQSQRYAATEYNDWFKKVNGRDMTPDEFLQTAHNEFSPAYYQYGDETTTYSNITTPKKGAGDDKKEEASFWAGNEWTSNNLESKNIFENIINPKSGDSYSALVESTTPTPDALKTLLESKDAVMTEDADGNPTYTYASSGAPMTTADAIATEAAVNDLTTKVNNSKALLAQMQPELDRMAEVKPEVAQALQTYKGIDTERPAYDEFDGLGRQNSELEDLQDKLESYGTIVKTTDGRYIDSKTNKVIADPVEAEKLYAVQFAEGVAGKKAMKSYDNQRYLQNEYIKKELSKSNVAGQMMILHDNKEDGKVTNELHQSFASGLNSAIKAGSVLDREGLVSTDDFLGKNGSGEFHGADFDPHSIYQKDGSWYARGNFIKKVNGVDETSPAIDINVNDIIKQQLPESADLQLQVFKQMDDQMQYILPGKQGVINLFGNRLDDLNTTQVKVTRGKDNSVTIESPNGLFADYDAETGIYKPHYVKGPKNYPSTSEASLDLLQSQIRIQQEREESPYAFDDNGNYVGDVRSDDAKVNEATVRAATDFISKSLNWDDKMIEGLIKTIDFETGHTFNPSEKNNTTGAGAVGLIQFYPDRTVNGKQYKRIGNTDYSMDQLADMSAHEQMKGPVVDYLAQFQNDIRQPHDIYLAVFQPALLKSKEYRMNGLDTKLDKVTEVTNWATIKRDNPAIFDKTKNGGIDVVTVKDLLEAAKQL